MIKFGVYKQLLKKAGLSNAGIRVTLKVTCDQLYIFSFRLVTIPVEEEKEKFVYQVTIEIRRKWNVQFESGKEGHKHGRLEALENEAH